jgi:non-specific serine/threonine protein kinase
MTKELALNTTLSHYRIVSKIGEGGMGEVWLAEDTRLGRKVALKLLPAEFTEDSERVRRFTQEAKAASALNHPNIISVYDIGECETGRFIVMEFVAGHTLRSVIAEDNSLETLFTLGAQMARALSAAHAAGITHRDIKPDNIMVRDDGYVKMLDFGLARLLPTTASDPEAMTLAQQTTPGTVMGTLAYMSPEQASGKTAGSASDVFALGIVLYELATGSHPFKSETMIGYLHAITSQTPPSITSLKSHLPAALDDLILRMLDKNAHRRPTASEVAQALQEIEKYGSSNTLPLRIVADKPKVAGAEEGFWVAVLPFKYRGNNADLEALAEGLSEDIVTGLSRFSCLRVIARGSTLRFMSENADVRSIGKQLGARYVMEGSLRQAGSMLRLVVQLVDATTGAHLWAETYDRTVDADKIFALQDELVPRIVSTVADWYGVLTHSMSEAVRLKPIDQVTPYEAVLRSFGYYERVTAEEHAAARSALERAVEQAPGNADGWAMLSMMYGEEYRFGFNEQPDPMGRSLKAARRAVDVAPSNHFAYLALAQALFFRKEFDAFRHAAERAIALNPMDGSTMEYVSHLIAFSGDWDYGCEVAERARQLNPNHPGWYWAVPFYNAYRNGDYPTARAFALKIDQPTVDLCQVMLAAVYGQLGEHEAADRTVQTLLSLTPDTAVTRKQLDKWYQPKLVEKLIDGLRKAGLNIDEQAAPSVSRSSSTEIGSRDGFWVAVLPFKFTGSNAEVATLAEGLSEEIVTGLSRFSYLRVIARGSTLGYANRTMDLRTVGKDLGARYIMEGSLRLAGSMLRIFVQLVDASTGAQLWAETYDRSFHAEAIFELQDELVPKIVCTAADRHGVLPHTMSEALRNRDVNDLRPYEVLLRGFGYFERVSAAEHAALRAALERVVEQAPNSDCWAMLAMMYCDEHRFGLNPLPDSLGRALAAAQRAVEASVSNSFAYEALAQSLFFRREFDSFRNAAERAIALNPFDGATTALMGLLIAYAGDWERGCSVAEQATKLNPHHPGWYWSAAFWDAYRKSDYRAALSTALKFNMPGLFYHHMLLAMVYGQLGELEAASKALERLLALRPDFALAARGELGKWMDPELITHAIDGLRKAGLDIADQPTTSTSSSPSIASSETRTDERFWIAVLPFKFTGSNTEVATLAEGLSEEIVTGLSRFSYLRVISRSSTLRYANETDDVRTVGKTLGARYVMEGSLRVAGSSLRISVQLIDAGTGAHLWAETYDRQFRAEEVFALQDDLVPRIVSTVADVNGVLPRSMSEVVCSKNPDELSPYEAVLRSFRYFDRVSPDELTAARSCLEIAVEKAPSNADAWAMLALLFHQDYGQGFNLHPDALNLGVMAAQRAVESGPSNHLAYFSLAQARFFQKDIQSFRNAAERAVALNPMDANSLAFMGELLTYVGDSERGLALATRAKEINPNHPGWFWYADYFHAYRLGDYRSALSLVLKANLPGHWGMHAGIAASAGQLGDHETAGKAIRDLLKLRPDYGNSVQNTLAKWFDPELCEQLLDGLRKAGLETGDEGTESQGDAATDSVSPRVIRGR